MNISDTISKLIRLYKTTPSLQEAFRFCVVGGLCSVIDACIFYAVVPFTTYHIALVSGYCLSLIVNYFLTIHWTFKKKASAKNAIGVVAAHLFNLFVIRMGLMVLFVDYIGLSEQIAFIPTFIISVVANFFIVRMVVNRL